MTKNIAILDKNGNQVGTTYPKRAKGMVKSGRACRIGENAIRFVEQPSAVTDERMLTKMTDVNEIIKKIDSLMDDKSHLKMAFDTIEKADAQWKAEAGASIAAEREKTIRKALDFYEDIYENIVPEYEEGSVEEEAEEN